MKTKEKPSAYIPKPGHQWNPLRAYPRNAECPCGKTKKKFKKCCLPTMGPVVTDEQFKILKGFMDKVRQGSVR